ncbi:DUF2897 family protein [Enterovibrio sp. 27052020O]|uniref:DUF2897 family protein n=1 Tax=Enterovibrio sp. 27052020O TaxID=3241166 RepID=UPI00388FE4AD
MDILTNPYVIIFIVVAVVVSNIMALKYTAKSKLGMRQRENKKDDAASKEQPKKTTPTDDDSDDKSSYW